MHQHRYHLSIVGSLEHHHRSGHILSTHAPFDRYVASTRVSSTDLMLLGMRLPKKQKIILVVTFGFGVFVAVVDVIRIYYLQDAQRDTLRAKQIGIPGDDM